MVEEQVWLQFWPHLVSALGTPTPTPIQDKRDFSWKAASCWYATLLAEGPLPWLLGRGSWARSPERANCCGGSGGRAAAGLRGLGGGAEWESGLRERRWEGGPSDSWGVRAAPTRSEHRRCCRERESFNHVLSTYCLPEPMVGDEDAVVRYHPCHHRSSQLVGDWFVHFLN